MREIVIKYEISQHPELEVKFVGDIIDRCEHWEDWYGLKFEVLQKNE